MFTNFVEWMNQYAPAVQTAADFVWSLKCLIPLLVGTGIYFTLTTGFVQVRYFGKAWRGTFGGLNLFGKRADKTGMSSFQALATAIAGQVGTGNLAGAATAIALGGPGAIFWMWIAAFFGMATIFAEAVLAQLTKSHDETGQVVGGPAYYIRQIFGGGTFIGKFLAGFFSIAIILALGFFGNAVQSNSIADSFHSAFHVSKLLVGVGLAVLCGFIFFGGMGRIASVCEKVVPLMAALYLLGGLWILIVNYSQIIPALKMIFVGAFDPKAVLGGALGATVKEAMRYGVARGLFSNEAGMGSTPHAHAVAKVKHPTEQGFVAIMGVFIDTFLVLNMTAFVIFVSGVLNTNYQGGSPVLKGIQLTQAAFAHGMGHFGNIFIAVCLFFFAFSTIIGWYFYGEQNIRYLFGHKGLLPYRVVVMLFVVLGSALQLDLVWNLSDFFNAVMVLPNLLGLICLGTLVRRALKDDSFTSIHVDHE